MKSLSYTAGLSVGIVSAVIAAEASLTHIRGRHAMLREVSVDGGMLVFAIASQIVFQVLLYIRWRRPHLFRWPFVDGMTVICLFAIPILALIVSIGPAAASVDVQREYVITPPAPPAVNEMGTIVMFSNGIRRIRLDEAMRLKQQIIVLDQCNATDIHVVGYASSAPFPSQNEERNFRLANLRAIEVVGALQKLHVQVRVQAWKTYDEMITKRRIRDTDVSGKRVGSLQALNRRAEILWTTQPGCSQ